MPPCIDLNLLDTGVLGLKAVRIAGCLRNIQGTITARISFTRAKAIIIIIIGRPINRSCNASCTRCAYRIGRRIATKARIDLLVEIEGQLEGTSELAEGCWLRLTVCYY